VSRFNPVYFNITVITFQYCSPLHLFQPTLCTYARMFYRVLHVSVCLVHWHRATGRALWNSCL